jgi:hypothetical protein
MKPAQEILTTLLITLARLKQRTLTQVLDQMGTITQEELAEVDSSKIMRNTVITSS